MGKAKDATPARTPSSLKKQNSSAGPSSNQRTIHNFFGKKADGGTPSSSNGVSLASGTSKNVNSSKASLPPKKPAFKKTLIKNPTPVPSSDAIEPPSSQENVNGGIPEEVEESGLLSPKPPAKRVLKVSNGPALVLGSSPSRKVQSFCATSLLHLLTLT